MTEEALRYCGISEHHSHVMYVWENTMNIIVIFAFFHAINNLVWVTHRQPAIGQDIHKY